MIVLLIGALLIWIGFIIDATEAKALERCNYTRPQSRVSIAVSNGFMFAGTTVLIIGAVALLAEAICKTIK